jgi:hypothetical protein
MKGHTLFPFQGKVVLKKKSIQLPSLPLALDSPVVIPVPLLNIGSNQVSYALDLAAFQKDHANLLLDKVVSFRNESGQLQPGERQNLLVLFKPNVDYRTLFVVAIKIKDYFHELETLRVSLFGRGKSEPLAPLVLSSLRVEDLLADVAEPVQNHHHRIFIANPLVDFRHSSLNRPLRRLVLLYNSQPDSHLTFLFESLNYFS